MIYYAFCRDQVIFDHLIAWCNKGAAPNLLVLCDCTRSCHAKCEGRKVRATGCTLCHPQVQRCSTGSCKANQGAHTDSYLSTYGGPLSLGCGCIFVLQWARPSTISVQDQLCCFSNRRSCLPKCVLLALQIQVFLCRCILMEHQQSSIWSPLARMEVLLKMADIKNL